MKKLLVALPFALFAAHAAHAEQHEVKQRDTAFDRKEIQIKVGEAIKFLNEDAFVHNIFTMTDPMFVDLGTFSEGESRSMTFSHAGEFLVECAIHPEMQLRVQVAQ